LDDRGAQALAKAPFLAGLTTLHLADHQCTVDGIDPLVAALFEADSCQLEELRLIGALDQASVTRLAQATHLDALRHLWLIGRIGSLGLSQLFAQARLGLLVSLLLHVHQTDLDGPLRALVHSPSKYSLRHLTLHGAFTDDGVVPLLETSGFEQLRHLDLFGRWGDVGLLRLIDAPMLGRITHLSLAGRFSTTSMETLASTPRLSALEALSLRVMTRPGGNRDVVPALAAFLQAPSVPGLQSLELNGLEDDAVVHLAQRPVLGQLTQLLLAAGEIGEAGCLALANSPFLSHLHHLDLAYNIIGDDAAWALAQSPHLSASCTVDLSGNLLSEEGRSRLLAHLDTRVRV